MAASLPTSPATGVGTGILQYNHWEMYVFQTQVVHVYSGADTRGVCHSLTSVLKLGFSLARAVDSISCSTRGVSVVSVVQQFRHDIAAALNWDCR